MSNCICDSCFLSKAQIPTFPLHQIPIRLELELLQILEHGVFHSFTVLYYIYHYITAYLCILRVNMIRQILHSITT